jgi:hypothetical protein
MLNEWQGRSSKIRSELIIGPEYLTDIILTDFLNISITQARREAIESLIAEMYDKVYDQGTKK